MKIMIGIPARDVINASFAHDLAVLVGWHCKNFPEHEVGISTKLGTLIVNQRQDLAKEAILAGSDYLLFLDADMRFPETTLARLLARDKDIVACNYPTRRVPPKPTAFKSHHPTIRLYTDEDSTGCEEVAAVGAGVMLIKVDVFKNMDLPLFDVVWDEYHLNFMGEDLYFCKKAREAGYTVWVDQDLSQKIMHVGMFEYLNAHTWDNREDEEYLHDEYQRFKAKRDGDYELRRAEDSSR